MGNFLKYLIAHFDTSHMTDQNCNDEFEIMRKRLKFDKSTKKKTLFIFGRTSCGKSLLGMKMF